MIAFLNFIEIFIFLLLALFHFYWCAGGRWGFESTLPVNEDGEKVINPSALECLGVAVGLLLCAIFYMLNTQIIYFPLPEWILKYAGWLIPGIFYIRTLGDFKYLGVFKKIRSSKFAKLDTFFFSPLCFLIGTIGLIIQIL